MIAVSIIVPCFNAVSKIGKCFSSLRSIDFPNSEYEVIFVDDCSTDSTYDFLKVECGREINWSTVQLSENSGSPSKPRNQGAKCAKGEYIFYLDCDDEILPNTLKLFYAHAKKTNACVVRGSLFADNGKQKILMNRIVDWSNDLTKKEKIKKIIAKQSTTPPQLVKTSLVVENNIQWPESIRMGEDTVFLIDLLTKAEYIEYLDEPSYIYNKRPTFTFSSTQSYGDRDLNNHMAVWLLSQQKMQDLGINYFDIRLSVGIQTVLASLIHKNRGDISVSTFEEFSKFVNKNIEIINSFGLKKRFSEIIKTLLLEDYESFIKLCRPRLVIAGHDLKFIMSAENELSKLYDIKYDQWKGHKDHDENKSRELLEWSEVIWCEWMLGNSQWYAQHKKNHQKLIIRMHRQELITNYAESIDFSKVDLVITVSVLFFERLLERFPNIPRHKVRLIPNYINVDEYDDEWCAERLFNIAMIGILPSRKNLHIGLEVLNKLREKDSRFKMSIYSKKPKELAWLARNKEEMTYFDQCDDYMAKYNLTESVDYKGHCDLKSALSSHKIGYVLSVSESSEYEFPGPESFHLAIADGYAGGGVSFIKHWAGCEYIFPNYMIKQSVDEIADNIMALRDDENEFIDLSLKGKSFIRTNYSKAQFIERVKVEISLL